MSAAGRITKFLQDELASRGLDEVPAVEAAAWLDEEGLLRDDVHRAGKPLRVLLREGQIEGGVQRPAVPNGRWFIERIDSATSPAVASDEEDEGFGAVAENGDPGAEAERARHRPDYVRILFVGESRPAGGTYFYFGNSILYHATREAFMRVRPDTKPLDFLAAFTEAGCYLEDLCGEPVDQMNEPDREAARKRGIPELADRIEGLEPDVVIVVMKSIAPEVESALEQAGLGAVPVRTVPFPRQKWRARYVNELSGYFEEWLAAS